MNDEPQILEAELARLADGSLPAARESELRSQVQANPELAGALAEQQRALSLLSAIDVTAPASLRAQVQQLTEAKASRAPSWRPRRIRLGLVLPTAAVLAVAVIVLLGGGASAPTVPQTVRLTLAAATLPAPQVDPRDGGQLELHVGAVHFPDGTRWAPAGARTDELAGRRIVTVFYRAAGGHRIGYAIVSGAPLRAIAGASVLRNGVRFTQARQGSANVVTWVRAGHTCVIAGTSVPSAELVQLAGYRS
jgi:hypothetical protein